MSLNIGKSKINVYCITCGDLCVRLQVGDFEKDKPDTYVIVHALYIDSLPEKFDADPDASI